MRFDCFTLFPEMFAGPFDSSIIKRAQTTGAVEIGIHDLRTWTNDKHRTADDAPYGGGAGMVMMAPPIVEGVESILGEDLGTAKILITSASGRPFDQAMALDLATQDRVVIICGHYEGIDARVTDLLNADEVTIGDYVLTGGELAAMVIIDATTRLLPGVIQQASIEDESHSDGLVEYPHYTRPFEYRGLSIPEILISGHHAKVETWRREQSLKRTKARRPDLLKQSEP